MSAETLATKLDVQGDATITGDLVSAEGVPTEIVAQERLTTQTVEGRDGALRLTGAVEQAGRGSLTDARNWIRVVTGLPTNGAWRDCIWVNELSRFVAVANSGTSHRVMLSADGVQWERIALTAELDATSWFGIAWSPELGRLVAVANTQNTANASLAVMTSDDGGFTWAARRIDGIIAPEGVYFRSVTWSSQRRLFVAVGQHANANPQIWYSSNAETWQAVDTAPLGLRSQWQKVKYAPELGIFCCIGTPQLPEHPFSAAISTDGKNWEGTLSGVVATMRGLVWSGKQFVAIGQAASDNLAISSDGRQWATYTTTNPNDSWINLDYAPELDLYYACSFGGESAVRFMYSFGGQAWTKVNFSANNEFGGLGNSQWIAIAWSDKLRTFVALNNNIVGRARALRMSHLMKAAPGLLFAGSEVRIVASQELSLGGDALLSASAGSPETNTLLVVVNGTRYKIALRADV